MMVPEKRVIPNKVFMGLPGQSGAPFTFEAKVARITLLMVAGRSHCQTAECLSPSN